jgi:monovalent cation:H+ antiporter-2, CPA2 family
VADQNRELVEKLRAEGAAAVSGDATRAEVLVQAHIARARMLVIAMRDTTGVRQMAAHARLLNPQIEIVVRSHNEEEARRLEKELSGRVFVGAHELAQAMSRYVVERYRA